VHARTHKHISRSFDNKKIMLKVALGHRSIISELNSESKGELHPCTGTEVLYRPYGQ